MITIIITYIDEHDFLTEAVESAQAQRLEEMELILVCNLASLPGGYYPLPEVNPNIRFIHEPHIGSAYARNAGLRVAAGDWVQFLDVDDLLMPDKILNQSTHADGKVIVSPHIFRFLDGSKQKSKWMPEDVWSSILDSGLGSTSSMLWHRETLVKIGGWNPHYQSHQEYELLFRMAAAGYSISCVGLWETIVRERISGSITLRSQPVRAKEGIQLRETIWEYLIRHGLDTPERKNSFLQYVFRQLRGVYMRNPLEAMAIYLKYFSGKHFVPVHPGIPFYPFLYRTFGFMKTERFIEKYRILRDKYLPFLPTNH